MHLAKSGRLIVKLHSSNGNLVGSLLVNNEGKKVGRIIETIGPITSPYASVLPLIDKTAKIIGSKVFRAALSSKNVEKFRKNAFAKKRALKSRKRRSGLRGRS